MERTQSSRPNIGARPKVTLVQTFVSNLASVQAALRRLGAEVRLSRDPEEVVDAELLVLPGVGTFAAGAASLAASGLDRALAKRLEDGRPTLAICLGMQLLFEGSEESPPARGIGVAGGAARRLSIPAQDPPLPIPHLGWNRVEPAGDGIVEEGWAYFAHSYCVVEAPPGWTPSHTTYGRRFVAALERGRILACQFHPELSGAYGLALMDRWMRGGAA